MKQVIFYLAFLFLSGCCFFEQFGDKETYDYKILSNEQVGEVIITTFVSGHIIDEFDVGPGQRKPFIGGEPLKIDQLGDYGGPFNRDSLRITRLSDSVVVTFVHYLIDTTAFIKYRDIHYFNRDIWLKEVNALGSFDFQLTVEMFEKMGK